MGETMNNNTKNIYIIFFWRDPKSGLELISKNTFIDKLEKSIVKMFDDDPCFNDLLKDFKTKNIGMVISHKIIESDSKIIDAEEEIMPLIKEEYPEAKYSRFKMISESNSINK